MQDLEQTSLSDEEALLQAEQLWSLGGVSAWVGQRHGGRMISRMPEHLVVLALTHFGKASTRIDDGKPFDVMLRPGMLNFHPANVTLDMTHNAGRLTCLTLDPTALHPAALEIFGTSEADLESLVPFDDPLAVQITRSLAEEIRGGPANRLFVDGLIGALAVQITRRFFYSVPHPKAERGLSRERVQRVLDYVEAHLEDELTLAETAGVACLSPTYFSRCFKQAVGVGLSRYVMQRRVERAKDLIRYTQQPLVAIAKVVGFTDQSYFTHIFQRETGTSPARFRSAVR